MLCPRTRHSRQASVEDSCRLDFDMLFDEGVASTSSEECRQSDRSCTYMYLRLLRRLCTSEDVHMRKVSEVVSGALGRLGAEDFKQRELVRRAVQTELEKAGYSPRIMTSRKTSGVLCSRHTYFTLSGSPDSECSTLIVEPLLREAFQIVRPTEQYSRLLDAVPMAFVGTPYRLSAITQFMAARMEESFRERRMSCPPWRKGPSLLARWDLAISPSLRLDSAGPVSPKNDAAFVRSFNDTANVNLRCGVETFMQTSKERNDEPESQNMLMKDEHGKGTTQRSGLLRNVLACSTACSRMSPAAGRQQ